MQAAALAILVAFALWIAVAGVAAVGWPALARGWIGGFASSRAINLAEQAWRGLAGAALILRGPQALAPNLFWLAGWIMVVSAAALLVIPLRWHANYARWWSRKLPLAIMRVAGTCAIFLAAGLVYAAWG